MENKNTIINKINKLIPILIYFLLFIFFAIRVTKLKLLLDDNVHIYPVITGNFLENYVHYLYGYGFFRPLALPFFYLMYSLYLWSSSFAHLFLFSIHFLTGIILKKTAEEFFPQKICYILSILYITSPFFIEQWGWIAASNATISNLLLFTGFYVILKTKFSFKLKLIFIFTSQTLSIFFYESVFFAFIPLGFALSYQENKKNFLKKGIIYSLIFSIPSIIYFGLRSFLFPAHNPETIRNITLTQFLNGEWFNLFLKNILGLFYSLNFLFLGKGSQEVFWKETFINGLITIFKNNLVLTIFIFFVIFLIFFLIKKYSKELKLKNSLILTFIFISLSFCTILPSLLVQQPSFPFRVISLPLFSLIGFFYFLLSQLFKKIILLIGFILIVSQLIFSQQILILMKNQSEDDEKLTKQLVLYLDKKLKQGEKTEIIINNFPFSTQTNFNYGEYLKSCLSINWCASSLLNRFTNKVEKITLNQSSINDIKNNKIIFNYIKNNKEFLLQ